jgi:hypothetical protein
MVIRSPAQFIDLATASEVIDALGGTSAAAALASQGAPGGFCSLPSVSNWRSSGRLPSYTFLLFTVALNARGYRAPSMLWSIAPVPDPATTEETAAGDGGLS